MRYYLESASLDNVQAMMMLGYCYPYQRGQFVKDAKSERFSFTVGCFSICRKQESF